MPGPHVSSVCFCATKHHPRMQPGVTDRRAAQAPPLATLITSSSSSSPTTMEAARGAREEQQVMKKSDLKIEEATAGGKQQQQISAMAPASPETGGVKLLCRSYSAETLKQRLTKTVKEHRARFYIVRRCIQMLICWRDEY